MDTEQILWGHPMNLFSRTSGNPSPDSCLPNVFTVHCKGGCLHRQGWRLSITCLGLGRLSADSAFLTDGSTRIYLLSVASQWLGNSQNKYHPEIPGSDFGPHNLPSGNSGRQAECTALSTATIRREGWQTNLPSRLTGDLETNNGGGPWTPFNPQLTRSKADTNQTMRERDKQHGNATRLV